tara:strand:- start:67247 stop:68335 length:1089 start_codon:yes stop_codon:yes gene_type:complete
MKIIIYSIIGLIVFSFMFYHLAPVFGAKIDNKGFEKIENFNKNSFVNKYTIDIKEDKKIEKKETGVLRQLLGEVKGREPTNPVKVNSRTTEEVIALNEGELIWFGHSTFLVKQSNKTLLFDPMFSSRPSPVPFLVKKRYNEKLVITPENLPEIDAVLISHDHYDHLDHNSILKLKEKTKKFIVPVGLDQHLVHWGVEKEKITVLKWWEETKIDEVKINLVPSQHFSGRRLTRNETLWGGFVINSNNKNIYFSGDTGYGSHFKEIKERFKKIDFALLEAGQYNINWSDIHMLPNQTVKAAEDLGVERFMPVHWGMFTLSTHKWTDPVERVKNYAKGKPFQVETPEIGQVFNVFEDETKEWWKQ